MSWFADLAGKAESLLNNLDEQTGAALRNHNVVKTKRHDRQSEYSLHPEPAWSPKKRPIPRSLRKIPPITEAKSSSNPIRKPITTSQGHAQTREPVREPRKVSPTRKSSPIYNLDKCPKTLVGDISNEIVMNDYGLKKRKFSLPTDLEVLSHDSFTYKMQNLEVENAMLKNELNVMNREVSELLDRLRKTEDGNTVVSNISELSEINVKLENSETLNHRVNIEKETLSSQLEQLKQRIQDLTTGEINKYKEENQQLQNDISMLRDRNKDLEDQIKEFHEKFNNKGTLLIKLENELRHAQTLITNLQSNLEKSTGECHRLERDWESYKLRVKNMLAAKDKEIKALQEGFNFTEDTKMLMEQIDNLKEEREQLSDTVSRMRAECEDMQRHVSQLEARHSAGERVVAALREALREERSARNRAEAQWNALAKELKAMQAETAQTIASLRTALRDKDSELNSLRETASTVRTTDTSALNVADYDVMEDSIDSDKIQYLTQMLVQRQEKIDSLLADNNMLKIQLEKLETKYKVEMASIRANTAHSVVHVQEGEWRSRAGAGPGAGAGGRGRGRTAAGAQLAAMSLRVGAAMRRYPVFRLFIIVYMIGLHFWVLTVLLTSTPENYMQRPTKL